MDGSKRRVPTGTVTFLFSDIEGSTPLGHQLDPPTYREVLEQHHRLLRAAFRGRGGIERGSEGDSFLVVYSDAPSAIAAAVEAQRALAAATWPAGVDIRVRMGLHTGQGIPGGDDYVGIDINRAARIASAAHGGQVLISDATRGLSERGLPQGVGLRDLGEHRLKGLPLPERLYQVTIEGLRTDFPPLRSLEVGSAHVPPRMTSFVGRREGLHELRRLLVTNRLITIVGPGGAGKTSLATEFAREVASAFADGAWFVDLAPLSDPDLIGPTVARSLGLREQAGQPIGDLLKAHLEPRQLLLVLDNFEHLLPAPPVIEEVLLAAPQLKAIVTSRSVLNLYGEQEFPLSPLALPDPASVADLDRLANIEAVALFIDRARAARPAFSVTNESAPAVARICLRLDGLPLAIELAASRVRLMEPGEILARLEQHLPVLSTAGSNVPARQRTLSGAIDWSYGLLHQAERRLFVRLAIFAGGWTLEAADAICNPGGELDLDTLDGIASLVDQSLVRRSGEAGATRFGMLETIRDYGRDRLEVDDSWDEISRRHLHYYRDLAELAEPHFVGVGQASWLDRFDREEANVRSALTRALDAGDAESGLRLAAALWRFWFQRGYLREGRSQLEALLSFEPASANVTRARAYTALGGLTYWLSDADATESAYESAAGLYREIGDRDGEAEALYNLGFVPAMRGNTGESRQRFEASLALAQEVGRSDLVAQIHLSLGVNALVGDDPRAALQLLSDARDFFRAAGDRLHLADALVSIAIAHRLSSQASSGRVAYREALRLSTETMNLAGIGSGLLVGAAVESSAGRHLEAVRMLGAVDALRETTGASAPQMSSVMSEVEDAARRSVGGGAVAEALAEGRRMTVAQAVEYAESLPD